MQWLHGYLVVLSTSQSYLIISNNNNNNGDLIFSNCLQGVDLVQYGRFDYLSLLPVHFLKHYISKAQMTERKSTCITILSESVITSDAEQKFSFLSSFSRTIRLSDGPF